MRVLMTLDGVGGVFTYAVDLISELNGRGVEVSAAVLGPALSADQRAALDRAGARSCHTGGFRLEWMEDPWRDLQRAEGWLQELERIEQPDLIHAGSFFCGVIGFRAPVLVVAHSCVSSWFSAVHGCPPPSGWRRYRDLVRDGLRGADEVVAPSRWMLESLRDHYELAPDRGIAIPNGSSVPATRSAREPLILAAGRAWDMAKNLQVLDRVAPRLDWPVLIAGELPAGEPADGRRWLGRLAPAALAELRRRASVFVSPAVYEPFGLGILEAARAGCALVLGDIPSLREVWGEAAVFVAPRDPDQIAGQLNRLAADPERLVSQGQAAQRHAERYSAAAMAEAYIGLYERLAGRAGERLVAP